MSRKIPFKNLRLWPRFLQCPWCGQWQKIEGAEEELAFARQHARCIPVPVREALEVGWGQEGVHGGGNDVWALVEEPPAASRVRPEEGDLA